MLQAVLWSLIGALICTGLTMMIRFLFCKKNMKEFITVPSIIWTIVYFCVDFISMMVFIYVTYVEQTVFTVIRYMWIPLLINFTIVVVAKLLSNFKNDFYVKKSFASTAILLGCSLIIFSICLIIEPVHNNLEYVHKYVHEYEECVENDKKIASEFFYFPEIRQVGEETHAVFYSSELSNKAPYVLRLKTEVIKTVYRDDSFTIKDALKEVRRKYPTVVIGDHKFDIDDDMKPYKIFCYCEKRYSTDGKDYGLIILNLMDGTCEKYPVSENNIPTWVDFKTTYPRHHKKD